MNAERDLDSAYQREPGLPLIDRSQRRQAHGVSIVRGAL
jgi:hypothetical protein